MLYYSGHPVLGGLLLAPGIGMAGLWAFLRFMRWFLWRVGRQLSFSYFLVGILPIPLLTLLLVVAGYIFMGGLVGYLFRQSLDDFLTQVYRDATTQFSQSNALDDDEPPVPGYDFSYYVNGQKTSGNGPEKWPLWIEEHQEVEGDRGVFIHHSNGQITAGAAIHQGDRALLAIWNSSIAERIRDESGIWVNFHHGENSDITIGTKGVNLDWSLFQNTKNERLAFFEVGEGNLSFLDRPILVWVESLDSSWSFDEPSLKPHLQASTVAVPSRVWRLFFPSESEVDGMAWAVFIVLAAILGDLYLVALFVAMFVTWSLSRAVNHLSKATELVQEGDFSTRIPVKRRDQLGALHRSFNAMTVNLENLVASEAQKESLERELQVARELQKSLLPTQLGHYSTVDIASYFEPSAAIGGDYFDFHDLDNQILALVIADVSGHGLSAGLRMAMFKAALGILFDQNLTPELTLKRLHQMVRSDSKPGEARAMVTATLSLLNLTTGELILTNAGHIPTYRIRDGVVEEILLPSSPLGGMPTPYSQCVVQLEPGDIVVSLSDGLVEAMNPTGELFGFDRVVTTLSQNFESATAVRDTLVRAVADFADGIPVDDDRTLVVLVFHPED